VGELSGKVAVVTGGGSGIGLATATRLADAGVAVAVVDLDGSAADRAATVLGGLGVQADVGRSDQWPGIVDAVSSRFGGIDLAHLNAGVVTGESDITQVTDDIYRRAVGVNVDGVVFGLRALVPALAQRGGGAIVATASLAGLIGFSPDPIYCLTKHAVVGLVRSLGPQLAEQHITINAVCPSIVDTPLIDGTRALLERSGFPLIDVTAVAETVVDLLSGQATGEAMVMQAGREALAFRFARPPGPRAGGTVGQMPPTELAAHDQG
jgi:NAD(P)-dependent dehydrogenase (short-subunit alcohol dehydrogenase family)